MQSSPDDFDGLMAASNLGSPQAKAIRAQTPPEANDAIRASAGAAPPSCVFQGRSSSRPKAKIPPWTGGDLGGKREG
jgi:hypothetical protein